MPQEETLVIGQGEIGKPIAEVLSRNYRVVTKDLGALELPDRVDVMHICFPYQIDDFVGSTVEYIDQYRPSLTIIHSTVVPGTTRAVHLGSGRAVAYSAVRGKHAAMKDELMIYTKFVGGVTPQATTDTMKHLAGAGMKVERFSSPEALELSKLLETTYLGLLIAWAQEVERYASEFEAGYFEIMRFTKEIDYLPPVIFQPGFIAGHCVMPNIDLLETVHSSPLVQAIKRSNALKKEEWRNLGRPLGERLTPIKDKGLPG